MQVVANSIVVGSVGTQKYKQNQARRKENEMMEIGGRDGDAADIGRTWHDGRNGV